MVKKHSINTDPVSPSCAQCASRGDSIFCALKNKELLEIDFEKGLNYYERNQKIFQEGTRPLGLYCIYNGKVKVYKSGFNGKEQIIRLAKEGDVLGYQSLISGENYIASAETLVESTLCFIPRSFFFGLLHKNEDLLLQVMQLLSHDLKMAENKVATLSQKPVRERVAETLLLLKETYGLEDDHTTLSVTLPREDLANITGTATETLIRILSEFRVHHIIELKGKKIMILDMEALLHAAALDD